MSRELYPRLSGHMRSRENRAGISGTSRRRSPPTRVPMFPGIPRRSGDAGKGHAVSPGRPGDAVPRPITAPQTTDQFRNLHQPSTCRRPRNAPTRPDARPGSATLSWLVRPLRPPRASLLSGHPLPPIPMSCYRTDGPLPSSYQLGGSARRSATSARPAGVLAVGTVRTSPLSRRYRLRRRVAGGRSAPHRVRRELDERNPGGRLA